MMAGKDALPNQEKKCLKKKSLRVGGRMKSDTCRARGRNQDVSWKPLQDSHKEEASKKSIEETRRKGLGRKRCSERKHHHARI